MHRRKALTDAADRLRRSGAPDSRLDAEWMLAHALGMKRLAMLMALDAPLAQEEADRYEALVSRREAGEPLQYVLGEADFMGHTFLVDSRVLIPRGDTETLCEEAVRRIRPGSRVLDIGTGSGALAVSMALSCPETIVTAVDISGEALAVARENAERLGAKVEWVHGDLLDNLGGRTFDVIVSNPPYIKSGDLPGLQREVRREPKLALDGGPDGLAFYRRITTACKTHLARRGSLLLEVGDGQARDVARMLENNFELVQTLPDLAGLDRVVIGDGYAG